MSLELVFASLSAAGALALRTRRRVMTVPIELELRRVLHSVDPVNQLKTAGNAGVGWRVELQHARTDVAEKKAPDKLRLCWVDQHGALHHYYELSSQDDEHEEHSSYGHAFVVFREPANGVEGLPLHARDIDQSMLVCAFRSRDTAAPATAAERIQLVIRITTEAAQEPQLQQPHTVAAFTQPFPDDEFRVLVRAPKGLQQCTQLPPPNEDWTLRYVFACPPLPSEKDGFDAHMHTVYVWGDIDFDGNGAAGVAPISDYAMNQIVPQVMVGRCLGGSDAQTFEPAWMEYERWVIQAQ